LEELLDISQMELQENHGLISQADLPHNFMTIKEVGGQLGEIIVLSKLIQ
jgi:hypothetical protein